MLYHTIAILLPIYSSPSPSSFQKSQVWLAFTDAFAEMGGLFFHRGSHLGGPLPHRVDGEAENLIGFRVDGADVMSDEAVPVELKAGEVTWNCTIRRDDLDGMGKGCGKDGRMEKGEGFFENFEKLEISIYDCESGVWCRIISC